MLYTRKGDGGKTGTFSCDQRISKSSATAEALGALDETNSYLGLAKVRCGELGLKVNPLKMSFESIIHDVQESLFIIQAEVAGFPKKIKAEKTVQIERIVDTIEKELPPIKTFFVAGGTELACLFDIVRTVSRRAERRVVRVAEEMRGLGNGGKNTSSGISNEALSYLNRLSSLMYALARYTNHLEGIKESAPKYK